MTLTPCRLRWLAAVGLLVVFLALIFTLGCLQTGDNSRFGDRVPVPPTELGGQDAQATKKAEVQSNEIVFRSRLRITPPAGLDQPLVVQRTNVSGTGHGYFVLQFPGAVDFKVRSALEEEGVIFYDYVPNAAFLVRIPESAFADVTSKVKNGEIRYVGSIPPRAKVQVELINKVAQNPQANYPVVVKLFGDPVPNETRELERLMTIESFSSGPFVLAEGQIPGSNVDTLARMPIVQWVEELVPATPGDK